MTPRAAALAVLAALPAAAEEPRVAAAISAPLPPYERAFAAFSAALGEPVAVLRPEDGRFPPPPPGARVVAAFGSRAALAPWPEGLPLVSCLALGPRPLRASTVTVSLLPDAAEVVKLLRERPERLGSVAVLWSDRGLDAYAKALGREGAKAGLRVLPARLAERDELPALLRELPGRAEAVLLLPDPALISATTVDMLAAFAKAHRIVFAASTEELVSRGATLSVGKSYEEVGRAAAAEAAALLRGERRPDGREP